MYISCGHRDLLNIIYSKHIIETINDVFRVFSVVIIIGRYLEF